MATTTEHLYLIALGSNRRHHLLGKPASIIKHAFAALEMQDISLFSSSSIMINRPIGPSQREYANAACIIASPLNPPELLNRLQSLETHFGRQRNGQRWRERTIDLDIILWSQGIWHSKQPYLSIPHPEMQLRPFVLQPAAEIAGNWRDPVTGLQIKQLFRQINHPKPLDP